MSTSDSEDYYETNHTNLDEHSKDSSFTKRNKTASEVLTLTEICLESIQTNFDRFHAAHLDTKDDLLKRNLLFLQRIYSGHFLGILTNNEESYFEHYLEEKYFDFLITEYVKELNMCIFHHQNWEAAIKVLTKVGHGLEKVTFQYNPDENIRAHAKKVDYLNDFVHKVVPLLPNAKSLNMHRSTRCADETLGIIRSSCWELEELTLDRCPVTDDGLKGLCPLRLRTLTLSFMRDCDAGLMHLLQLMPSLETLAYDNLPNILHELHREDLRSGSLAADAPLYNLTTLTINTYMNCRNDVATLEETLSIAAAVCPNIRKVFLADVSKPEHLDAVARFPRLVDVSISGHVGGVGGGGEGRMELVVDDFLRRSGRQLQVLELHNFRVSVAALVRSCPRLEQVRLGGMDYSPFPEEEGKALSPLGGLRKLIVESVEASDRRTERSLAALFSCCPALEELVFTCCLFEADQDLNGVIQGFCERTADLRALTFTGCTLEEALLQHIVLTCRSLRTLVVDLCDYIGSYEIENLREIIRASKSGLVIECTSKSEIDYFDSNDEDLDDDYLSEDRWDDGDDDDDDDYYDEDYEDRDDVDYENLYFGVAQQLI